jgi:hypothetical protein
VKYSESRAANVPPPVPAPTNQNVHVLFIIQFSPISVFDVHIPMIKSKWSCSVPQKVTAVLPRLSETRSKLDQLVR